MISAQVEHSQSGGHYGVAFSGDGFQSLYQFYGTGSEIRTLLADIEAQLTECERWDAESAAYQAQIAAERGDP